MRRRVNPYPSFQRRSVRRIQHAVAILIALATVCVAQEQPYDKLPKKIRGYKLHKERILISTETVKEGSGKEISASVRIGEPLLAGTGLAGVTFALPLEIASPSQSGKVEDYTHAFDLRKGEVVSLREPARIFLPTGRILQAAWYEMRDKKPKWQVTGRVFIFGRFRRFGFVHKRVVPMDVDILVANPFAEHDPQDAVNSTSERLMFSPALR